MIPGLLWHTRGYWRIDRNVRGCGGRVSGLLQGVHKRVSRLSDFDNLAAIDHGGHNAIMKLVANACAKRRTPVLDVWD
jgi:hypothetical protein